jgi:hypothetical protein
MLLSKEGRKLYWRLLTYYMRVKALEPAENPRAYSSVWWTNTFPNLPDSQMIELYWMKRATIDWIYERMVAVAPVEQPQGVPMSWQLRM